MAMMKGSLASEDRLVSIGPVLLFVIRRHGFVKSLLKNNICRQKTAFFLFAAASLC